MKSCWLTVQDRGLSGGLYKVTVADRKSSRQKEVSRIDQRAWWFTCKRGLYLTQVYWKLKSRGGSGVAKTSLVYIKANPSKELLLLSAIKT